MTNIYNDKVVGFKKEAETIIDQLIRGPKERDVVLITGMGGLGKTTLARRVYDEKIIVNYFDNRAWCTVSQEYDYKGLLHKVYSQVCGSDTGIADVAEKLRKSLMGKRYLIVLDDIWNVEAWEELNRVFPSCDNGSRIVLTSRQENMDPHAKHICLPFFTIDESWELLRVKLFKGEKCPEVLENVGREISKKCGGVPLVVSLVAGLLEGIEMNDQMWHEFLTSLNSYSALREGIQSNDAIELSYKHLSHHLKPCLLYFAAFPEDEVIDVSYLVKLWIAEGFIDTVETERVEDKAEDYLNRLVGSNLIMVSERKYDGHILSCMVHDLVRDFCLTKAKNESFLQIILLKKELDPTLSFTPHRISFHRYEGVDDDIPYELVPWSSSIRTLLGFRCSYFFSGPVYNGSWIDKKFEHLTILDLEFIYADKSIFSEVNSLIHLRYLALTLQCHGSGSTISPLSLRNLECLITLKLRSHGSLHLPIFFWGMRSLRHMIIDDFCDLCESGSTPHIEVVPSSEVIETLDFKHSLCTRDTYLLRKLPHLKKLSCFVSESCPFAEIEFLHHLESLKLSVSNGFRHLLSDLKLTKFPSSIKEIHFYRIIVRSSAAISIIAQLPNLEAVILHHCYVGEGVEWNVEEETQFRKLKYLELELINFMIWNSNAGESFPCLEQLVLKECACLMRVPSSLADITTLKLISVYYCKFVVWCVEKIEEDAREMGNEQLKVKITGPVIYPGEE